MKIVIWCYLVQRIPKSRDALVATGMLNLMAQVTSHLLCVVCVIGVHVVGWCVWLVGWCVCVCVVGWLIGWCVWLVGVVWCGVVWCGVVWCGVVWCGVVWCGVVCVSVCVCVCVSVRVYGCVCVCSLWRYNTHLDS